MHSRIALAVALPFLVAACSASHGADDDSGPALDGGRDSGEGGSGLPCVGEPGQCGAIIPGMGGAPSGCCIPGGGGPQTCFDGTWQCRRMGTVDERTCRGIPACDEPPVIECDVPSVCVLRPESCCGSCGAPTREDRVALHRDRVDAYVAGVCDEGMIGCPECARPRDPTLIATCRGGRCEAVDLQVEPLTECAVAGDCTLAAIDCCACGLLSQYDTVAFNPASGSLGPLICDPDADCDPCVPEFGTLSADCVAGRCTVVAE